MQHLHGAYRYALQETFAIPIVDEIKNDGSEINKSNETSEDNNENQDDSNVITDNDIENISSDDLDLLFTSETA